MINLTDLDICKRIAEISDLDWCLHPTMGSSYITKRYCDYLPPLLTWVRYNPLTDDALCFQLMVKYKVTVEFTRFYEHLKSTTTKAYYDDSDVNGYGAFIRDISPNKAICLAIIEAHKND